MENQLKKIKDYFEQINITDYKVISEKNNKPYFKFIYNGNEYTTPEIDYITFDNVKKEIDTLLNINDDIDYQELLLQEKDKYLRLYSDFENYKKRTKREIETIIKTASKKIVLDILDLIDDFERALTHHDETGLNLIYNKFNMILINNNIISYANVGDDFNSDIHDAVAELSVDDKKINKIINIITKGYKMNNEIIRYAKVVVGKK